MSLIPNHTQIPNIILDEWMSQLNGGEFKILMVIARQTYGWVEDKETGERKKTDRISYSQLCHKSGLSNTPVSNALRKLEELGFIEVSTYPGEIVTTPEQRNGKKLYYGIISKTILKSREESENLSKNSSRESREEPLYKVETQKKLSKETNTKVTNTNVLVGNEYSLNELIALFEKVNPNYERLFSNKTERKALEEMVIKYSSQKVRNMLEQLPEIVSRPYAPRITSPLTLQKKLADLLLFLKQEAGKEVKNGNQITVITPDPGWETTS